MEEREAARRERDHAGKHTEVLRVAIVAGKQ